MEDRSALTVDSLPAIDLEQLESRAGLLTRVDRKYVLDAASASAALAAVADRYAALEIDCQRRFGYESLYFDTADGLSYRRTATQRPNRFKVRTRRYLSQGSCMLEVKTLGKRSETIKQRIDHDDSAYDRLNDDSRRFIDSIIGPGISSRLEPTVTTSYQRSTVVDLDDNSRATIDISFAGARHHAPLQPLGKVVIVETKTLGRPSALDRVLWQFGERPQRISKFAVTTALLTPGIAANRWNRVLREHFAWTPNPSLSPIGNSHPTHS